MTKERRITLPPTLKWIFNFENQYSVSVLYLLLGWIEKFEQKRNGVGSEKIKQLGCHFNSVKNIYTFPSFLTRKFWWQSFFIYVSCLPWDERIKCERRNPLQTKMAEY